MNTQGDYGNDDPDTALAEGSEHQQIVTHNLLEGEAGPSSAYPVMKPMVYQKHMPPLDWEEIYILFDDWASLQTDMLKVSHSTVKQRYMDHWRKRLPFRRESQHAMCSTCTEFKQWRKRVPEGSPEAIRITAAWVKHMHDQKADRVLGDSIAHSAKVNFTAPGLCTSDPCADLLNTTIDAVEQAKFKIPRLEKREMSKDAAGKWRPQLHITGMVMDGVQELWYISNCTLPKNANTQITYLADSFDAVEDVCCCIGRSMPRMYRVFSDNATGETKNQTVFKFLAWLAHTKTFDCTEAAMQRVGHSHNRQDQRFSVACTTLSHSQNLPMENEMDFAEAFVKEVKPMPGMRDHKVTVLKAAWDWRAFFEPLEVSIHGHTSTAQKKAQTPNHRTIMIP